MDLSKVGLARGNESVHHVESLIVLLFWWTKGKRLYPNVNFEITQAVLSHKFVAIQLNPTNMADSAQETFTAALGDSMIWDESWQCLAQIDPEIFHASVNLMAVPRKKNHLSAKMQALVALTVDSNSTHLYTPGIRQHVKAAAAAGATKAEVLEVLELSSTLGIHACNIGIPTLIQVLKEENMYDSHPTAGKPFDKRRLALKDDFAAKRGYWHTFWEDFLALDPEFFEAYTEFSSVPWTRRIGGVCGHAGALENAVRIRKSDVTPETQADA
jgi:alkylhydroperoxidase/carboxymuconolactone decarboxylase family protein YurZ